MSQDIEYSQPSQYTFDQEQFEIDACNTNANGFFGGQNGGNEDGLDGSRYGGACNGINQGENQDNKYEDIELPNYENAITISTSEPRQESANTHIEKPSDSINTKKKQFRVAAKAFALTFPQCNLDKQVLADALGKIGNPIKVCVSMEKHEDGSPHLHAYLIYTRKLNIKDPKHFDVLTFHCNVQAVKDRDDWLKYIKKDGNWCEWTKDFDPDDYDVGKKKRAFDDATWAKQYQQKKQMKEVLWPIQLDNYEMVKPDPTIKKRHWWIVTPPDAGKTYWMNLQFKMQQAYVPAAGKFPFEHYNNEPVIVYDDRLPCFKEVAAVSNTHWLATHVWGDVRYTAKFWEMGSSRNIIVLTNKKIQDIYHEDLIAMQARFIEITNEISLKEAIARLTA